jgi:hypothetical protein
MKSQDDEVSSDFEHTLPGLIELVKILSHEPDGPEKSILAVSLSAKYQACKKLCDLQYGKIKEVNQIKQDYYSGPQPCNNPSPSEDPVSVRKSIDDAICAIDPLKWKYVFLTERDYNRFIEVTSNFFLNKKYKTEFELILKKGCKTRFCSVLNTVYHNFCMIPLSKNLDFLNLMRNLSVFKNQSTSQIYLDIKRGKDLS